MKRGTCRQRHAEAQAQAHGTEIQGSGFIQAIPRMSTAPLKIESSHLNDALKIRKHFQGPSLCDRKISRNAHLLLVLTYNVGTSKSTLPHLLQLSFANLKETLIIP